MGASDTVPGPRTSKRGLGCRAVALPIFTNYRLCPCSPSMIIESTLLSSRVGWPHGRKDNKLNAKDARSEGRRVGSLF